MRPRFSLHLEEVQIAGKMVPQKERRHRCRLLLRATEPVQVRLIRHVVVAYRVGENPPVVIVIRDRCVVSIFPTARIRTCCTASKAVISAGPVANRHCPAGLFWPV